MATKMSQKEYLKKYLSGGSDKKKKKKDKKAKNRTTTVKIIDDDEHWGNHMEIDEELLLTGEDAPQIVGVIDISGENGESKKWKSIGCTGPEVKSEAEQADDDLWGKKATSSMRVKSPDRNRKAFEQSPTRRPNDIGKVRRISDQSPPRKRSNARGDQSPPRKQSPGKIRRNSDQSPPRRRSSPRMRRNIDKSPARRRSPSYSNRDSHRSPPRRRSPGRTRRDSDQSPRGKRSPAHSKRDFDQSPDRKKKNADISPPRRRSPAHSKRNSDQSPPRRRSPAHSKRDSDQSPPRRQSPAHLKRDSDQSPFRRRSPGRTRKDSDPSPPRRRPPASSKGDTDQHIRRKRSPGRSRWDSDQSRSTTQVPALNDDADLSPVRIKREKSTDQSPPRRRNNDNPFRSSIKVERLSPDSSTQRNRSRRDSDQSPVRTNRERISESPPPTHKPSAKMSKTLDGKRAGLQDARTLKLETEERRRQEDKLFNKMSSDISGRDAEVQVRQSSSYRRRRKDLEEDPEVQRKKAEHEQQKKELYDRWNKGLKQIEARKAKFSDDQYESTKPLARYSNDADLDEMLRHQERHDDPMLAYMRNKKKDQMKAANIPVMPKYNGSYPENRFGIPPGYRWDGVDRSNGYERKWFDVQNQKKALADEAYKYSTEDM